MRVVAPWRIEARVVRRDVREASWSARRRGFCGSICSSDRKGSWNDERTSSPPRRPPRSTWDWLAKRMPIKQAAKGALAVGCVVLLFRTVHPGGVSRGKENQSSAAATIVKYVPFSDFLRAVNEGRVESVEVEGTKLVFLPKSGTGMMARELQEDGVWKHCKFATLRPADFPMPYELLQKMQVSFGAPYRPNNQINQVLVYLIYLALLVAFLSNMPQKFLSQDGATNSKGIRTKNGLAKRPSVTFADVAGVDEAREELQEIVEYLKHPSRYSKVGARPPSGVLLVGPPGTGKTLIAKAVAGEAGVPFYSTSASEFVELYVGMGALRVRELFSKARKESPSIVFIDEIDAVAKGRDNRLRSVGNDEREQTLNQLLTELDGFNSGDDNCVICIAATNRPDVLDPALRRPGRFDRIISVERPDRIGREQILRVHSSRRKLPLDVDVDLGDIAQHTTGFTGADLENLVNEAALLAGRKRRSVVAKADFEVAIMRNLAGIEKKRSILKGLEKTVVAKHEVGHALVGTAVAKLVPGASHVEKLSIVPRSGGALGFTYFPPSTEDRALMFESELLARIVTLLGGRAAEEVSFGFASTGAVDDIQKATELAYKMVAEYGLNDAIGPLSVSVLSSGGGSDGAYGLDQGQATSRLVEKEVKSIIESALDVAKDVIRANTSIFEQLAASLEETERLEGEGFRSLLGQVVSPHSLQIFVEGLPVPDVT